MGGETPKTARRGAFAQVGGMVAVLTGGCDGGCGRGCDTRRVAGRGRRR